MDNKRMIIIYTIICSIIVLVCTWGGYKVGYDKGENLTEVIDKYQSQLMQKVDNDPVVNTATHLTRLAAYENAHGQSELYDEITAYLKELAIKLETNGEDVTP